MKIKTLLLLAAILFIATTAMAQTSIPNSNLTWKLETDSTLTIDGMGAMPDFTSTSASRPPWYNSRVSIKTIVIGNNVTSIGNYAFNDCLKLTSISFGNSVATIGNYAFGNCQILPSLNIPNSVISIGSYAFNNCFKLTNLSIGDLVATIGDYAFNNCHVLSNLSIPNSVISIGTYAFSNCHELTKLSIPNSITKIENYTFNSCLKLTRLSIGNSVASIGNSAFNGCSELKQIDMKATAPPSIGTFAFRGILSATATLYVPCQSVTVYQSNTSWKSVSNNIVGNVVLFITAESANITMGSAKVISASCATATAIIAATANTGYTFTQWHDGNTDNPREVSATTDNLFTAEFEVAGSVGINNVVTGGIYSNSNGTFTIDASGGETFNVTVINMQGQVVKRETVRGGNNTINIGNQPAGVYVFVVDNGRERITAKVIKN